MTTSAVAARAADVVVGDAEGLGQPDQAKDRLHHGGGVNEREPAWGCLPSTHEG